LRIGLSAAKGLCFATGIPLIATGTLEIIARASNKMKADLFCPMIDARRLEVFTALYDKDFNERMQPMAMILDQDSFAGILSDSTVCFCGNGQKKLQSIITHPHAIFDNTQANAADMAALTHRSFLEKRFSDLVYIEPLYVKEFYTPVPGVIK
jgi:tRNA threonylcarbamoyladenosine biosynthesis protein TsaB